MRLTVLVGPGLVVAATGVGAADLVIVQTNHPEYKELSSSDVPGVKLIIDGRNLYTPADVRAMGFQYSGIGRA